MDEYTVTVEKTLVWKVNMTASSASEAEGMANDIPENKLGDPDSEYWNVEIFDS